MEAGGQDRQKLCRVILTDNSTTVICARPGQSICDAITKLCDRRHITMALIDVTEATQDKVGVPTGGNHLARNSENQAISVTYVSVLLIQLFLMMMMMAAVNMIKSKNYSRTSSHMHVKSITSYANRSWIVTAKGSDDPNCVSCLGNLVLWAISYISSWFTQKSNTFLTIEKIIEWFIPRRLVNISLSTFKDFLDGIPWHANFQLKVTRNIDIQLCFSYPTSNFNLKP